MKLKKKSIKIINVVGARPNFIKMAPVTKAMSKHTCFKTVLVHTGQHYDKKMSGVFFKDLDIPKPNINLGVASLSHSQQIANIIIKFDKVIKGIKPDLVVVYGDVNSTIACALAANKNNIKVAHVEAGLRSYDRKMPEEINRVVTDKLSDILFTPSIDAGQNLLKEGVDECKIHFVGNVMIDSFLESLTKINASLILDKLRLEKNKYSVLTLHRPSNVDKQKDLKNVFLALEKISNKINIVFPVHPRTLKCIDQFLPNKNKLFKNIRFLPPLSYLEFLKLMKDSFCVLTDSGGIQEETTFLGVPCLTLRSNTERPITVSEGTNRVTGLNVERIVKSFNNIKANRVKRKKPKYWDGKASVRISEVISRYFGCE